MAPSSCPPSLWSRLANQSDRSYRPVNHKHAVSSNPIFSKSDPAQFHMWSWILGRILSLNGHVTLLHDYLHERIRLRVTFCLLLRSLQGRRVFTPESDGISIIVVITKHHIAAKNLVTCSVNVASHFCLSIQTENRSYAWEHFVFTLALLLTWRRRGLSPVLQPPGVVQMSGLCLSSPVVHVYVFMSSVITM